MKSPTRLYAFLSAIVLVSGVNAHAANQLTVTNQTSEQALISITQDGGLSRSFTLNGQSQLIFAPGPQNYSAQAVVQLGSHTFTSSPIAFSGNKRIVARIFCAQGFADFELLTVDSLGFRQIELENQTQTQVQFTVAKNSGELTFRKLTDPQSVFAISTREIFDVGAVVGNFTIPSVTVTVPASVDLVTDPGACPFKLQIEPPIISRVATSPVISGPDTRTVLRLDGEVAARACMDRFSIPPRVL